MVQPLISFTLDTPEKFFAFVDGLRKHGVLKFQDHGTSLDLVPGSGDEEMVLDPTTEMKRQKVKDAFKTVQQLEQEAKEDLEWSMP